MAGIVLGLGATISAIVGAVAGVGSAIVGGSSDSKKNQAMINASQIDQRNQLELNKAMAQAKDKTERLKIYADSIGNIKTAQQNALIQAQIVAQQTSADAEKKNLVIVSIGGGAIAIASLFVLKN